MGRQFTSEHATDMTKLLRKLVSKGVLLQDGQRRWARYHLSPESHSLHKESHSLHKMKLPDIELDRLIEIAKPAKENRRLSSTEVESTLLNLCQKHWLTSKQLGELIERNADGLRSRSLTPMVKDGRLRLRYSEKPNRVDQAYIINTDPQK